MSEAILRALMQLFALIVDIDEVKEVSESERAIIRSFLGRLLNHELVEKYMKVFDEYLYRYHGEIFTKDTVRDRKRTSLTAVRILGICEQINEELEQPQKIYVLIQLIEYIAFGIEIREKELDFLQTVASAFNIPDQEYQNILAFVAYSLTDIPRKEQVLLISGEKKPADDRIKHIRQQNLSGEIAVLHIPGINTYVLRYHGQENLYLNGQRIHSGLTYIFEHGSSIRGQNIDPIYYPDVADIFTSFRITSRISLVARNVVFRFKNSDNGVHEFNLEEESGKLVGIMGGSGVGKSTLLNVLNGNLKPDSGKILINGYRLNDEHERGKLHGVIGFIPQEDLLIEDLTVFQNLYYNALLCLDDYDEEKIRKVVDQVLIDLNLQDIRDFKVGKPLSKVISGGQRKRVNIGLELIREPSILFVDEPTSGLSSVDSEMVMNLLREQVHKGKLVVVNIHQPSSNLYKMFDKIIFLDRGGYQIFYGNPLEAVVYFKSASNHANANEDQCPRCGNVDPDQVLQIIEARIVNEHGKLSRTRKVSPREWFELFKSKKQRIPDKKQPKEKLPENYYSIPRLLKQMRIFFSRDLLSKLTNRQYVLISLLEAPLLAVILGYFTKYFSGTADNPGMYVFRNNENLPAYLLMSVIVFLFLGLIISSEEIIKDRKILQRESFLNLSRFSYLNSKILIMFMISAIQTLFYVLVGNLVVEIRGMTFSYWLILFTTACFANLLGLNISSGLNSVITIYILIPFLLIPQILFSGVLVKFDKLHKSLTNYEYVPVLGDMMTSRWAFEALAVEQFRNNKYRRHFFDIDQDISNLRYLEAFLIPTLETTADESWYYMSENGDRERTTGNLEILREQIKKLDRRLPGLSFDTDRLKIGVFDRDVVEDTKAFLEEMNARLRAQIRELGQERSRRQEQLIDRIGGLEAFSSLRNDQDNQKLADMLLNRNQLEKIIQVDHQLIRKFEPVYMIPTSNRGRAHFYAPCKRIGNTCINTLWFNLIFIWFTSVLLYLALYYDLLRKVINYAGNIKIRI
ncbi:MAG: ATP-binding cassette domain-containing protein [Bacteroidales bacterium]